MMKLIMSCLFVLVSLSGLASENQAYRFGNMIVAFKVVDGMLVNNSCNECEALKTAREYGKEPLNSDWLQDGKNPFAVRCTVVMKGAILIGVDRHGNENAFCFFHKDKSFFR